MKVHLIPRRSLHHHKKLCRLPHVFSRVLELPFRSDADVIVHESPACFRFVAEAGLPFASYDVRTHAVEIYPGVTKIVVRERGNSAAKLLTTSLGVRSEGRSSLHEVGEEGLRSAGRGGRQRRREVRRYKGNNGGGGLSESEEREKCRREMGGRKGQNRLYTMTSGVL